MGQGQATTVVRHGGTMVARSTDREGMVTDRDPVSMVRAEGSTARVESSMVAHTMGAVFIGDAGFHPTGNIPVWWDGGSSAAR